jgi:hypothetical protein
MKSGKFDAEKHGWPERPGCNKLPKEQGTLRFHDA